MKSDRDKDSATVHDFSPHELKELDSAQFRVGTHLRQDRMGEVSTPERGPGRLRLLPHAEATTPDQIVNGPKEATEGNIKILEYSGEPRKETKATKAKKSKSKSGSGSSGSGSSSSSGDDDDSGSNGDILENSVEDSSSSSNSSGSSSGSSSKASNPS